MAFVAVVGEDDVIAPGAVVQQRVVVFPVSVVVVAFVDREVGGLVEAAEVEDVQVAAFVFDGEVIPGRAGAFRRDQIIVVAREAFVFAAVAGGLGAPFAVVDVVAFLALQAVDLPGLAP